MTMQTSTSSHSSLSAADRLARGLGWFSIGLGAVQLFAPRLLTEALGVEGKESLVRGCGARSLITGIGALSDNPVPAIWGRVGGDALDIAGLSMGLRDNNPKRRNVELALAAALATAAVDVYCAQALGRRHRHGRGPTPDYSDRSGFYRPVAAMRGAASDFVVPRDMRAAPPMWDDFLKTQQRDDTPVAP